jgi:hypothetical protein
MVRSALKYGYAKVKFTANVTCLQTSVALAAQAVKVAVRKDQHHLADAATKEAANVVVIAEVAVTEEEAQAQVVTTNVAVAIVRVAQVARVVVKAAIARVAEIVQVVREEDRIDLRCEI